MAAEQVREGAHKGGASGGGGGKRDGGLGSIHWFRKGLRLHDNPALVEAASGGVAHLYPVFVIDPTYAGEDNVGLVRYRFLLESLRDLDAQLRLKGSRLLVARGDPTEVVPALLERWGCAKLTYESDTEPYAKARDAAVGRACRALGVEVLTRATHTLRDPEQYLASFAGKGGSKVPGSYQGFGKLFDSLGAVPKAVDAPSQLPPPGDYALDGGAPSGGDEFAVPTLAEMGYSEAEEEGLPTPVAEGSASSSSSSSSAAAAAAFFAPRSKASSSASASSGAAALPRPVRFPGGETEALRRMREHCARSAWVHAFEKPKTAPNSLDPTTTVLSPYLKFGCLSPRVFWHALEEALATEEARRADKKSRTLPPVSLHGQLLWREYFTLVGGATANFDKMEGNPICKQIDWDANPDFLRAWEEGRTGYPFIDAIMTQLRVEGWIHHLARHAAACFLTRGDLYLSWEKGAKVFDRLLIDSDWSLNNANWMWLSASSFFYQYFRVYSPVAFGKKTDPNGDYIRKWVPQLRKYPAKFIFEPWKAPLSVQKQCGCVVGEGYPERIVDHDTIHKINMGRMKNAYDRNKAAAAAGASTGGKRDRAPTAETAKKKAK